MTRKDRSPDFIFMDAIAELLEVENMFKEKRQLACTPEMIELIEGGIVQVEILRRNVIRLYQDLKQP